MYELNFNGTVMKCCINPQSCLEERSSAVVALQTSSRSGVQYVGSVGDWPVWRFWLCLHLETGLATLDRLLAGSIPACLWDICAR